MGGFEKELKVLVFEMNTLLYKVFRRIRKIIMSKESYMNWEDNESFRSKVVRTHYNKVNEEKLFNADSMANKQMVFMINGYLRHGGLADRLRGALSTYLYAKENGIRFRIFWNSPFEITDYLKPNLVNWQIEESELIYDMPKVVPMYIGSYYKRLSTPAEEERKLQYKWMDKIVAKTPNSKQYHVYSNAHFCEPQYASLFNELFIPSDRIALKLEGCMKESGKEFIAASFRFMQLLGDFEDRCGGQELETEKKELYIKDALKQIVLLHSKHGGVVLVASDSSVFVERAKALPYVYVIPGEISHVDAQGNTGQTFDKEFLDLLLLSKAKYIYRLHRAPMHYSGFPLTAGMIGNVNVETIEF